MLGKISQTYLTLKPQTFARTATVWNKLQEILQQGKEAGLLHAQHLQTYSFSPDLPYSFSLCLNSFEALFWFEQRLGNLTFFSLAEMLQEQNLFHNSYFQVKQSKFTYNLGQIFSCSLYVKWHIVRYGLLNHIQHALSLCKVPLGGENRESRVQHDFCLCQTITQVE